MRNVLQKACIYAGLTTVCLMLAIVSLNLLFKALPGVALSLGEGDGAQMLENDRIGASASAYKTPENASSETATINMPNGETADALQSPAAIMPDGGTFDTSDGASPADTGQYIDPETIRDSATMFESIDELWAAIGENEGWLRNVTKEQALALFQSINSLDDVMELIYQECSQFSWVYGSLVYWGLGGEEPGLFYQIVEDFVQETSQLVYYSTITYQKEVLATKALPAGYTIVDAHDTWYQYKCPWNCISLAKMNEIIATGYLAPFFDDKNLGAHMYKSDDQMVYGTYYYVPELKSFVFFNENYRIREMYWTFSQMPSIKVLETGPYDGRVPLAQNASQVYYKTIWNF